jgi:hypothetical protein
MWFRVGLLVSFASLALACSEGGTGTGTAPPISQGCPADPDASVGKACSGLVVCAYPSSCPGAATCTTTRVLSCTGAAGAVWTSSAPPDAGGFADANLPDTAVADATVDAPDDTEVDAAGPDADASEVDADPTGADAAAGDAAGADAAPGDAAGADATGPDATGADAGDADAPDAPVEAGADATGD